MSSATYILMPLFYVFMYRNVLKCIEMYLNVLKCIEVY